MRIELDIPDPAALPAWAWVTLGVVAWYVFAGLVMRLRWVRRWLLSTGDDEFFLILFYSMSPVLLPAGATILIGWVAGWALSFGLIPAPWHPATRAEPVR